MFPQLTSGLKKNEKVFSSYTKGAIAQVTKQPTRIYVNIRFPNSYYLIQNIIRVFEQYFCFEIYSSECESVL